jgi:hypothetical protein
VIETFASAESLHDRLSRVPCELLVSARQPETGARQPPVEGQSVVAETRDAPRHSRGACALLLRSGCASQLRSTGSARSLTIAGVLPGQL